MDRAIGRLTVYFEEPFWVGVFERIEEDRLSVAKVTFGAEPKDHELHEFVLKHFYDLRFSPAVRTVTKATKRNPKKARRDARKQMKDTGIGTKSQQALKLRHEMDKRTRKTEGRERRREEEERLFLLKQQKKREKRKGH